MKRKKCVGLLDEKPGCEPQTSSQQISGKNSESKLKTAMKSLSKNLSFGVDFKTVGSATHV